MPNNRFYEIKQQASTPDRLQLYIYSDVQADYEDYDWENNRWKKVVSETSSDFFRKKLDEYQNINYIDVYINSCGGSVMEGVAIYNQLRRHKAFKTVYIDGFACSIASVIAMAGDKVVMPANAVMMIHNAWTWCAGNAAELRKAAEDLDKINDASRQAYLQKSQGKISESELIQLLDAESYLTAKDCIKYGLADEMSENDIDLEAAKQKIQQLKQNNLKQYAARLEKVLAVQQESQQIRKNVFEEEAEKILKDFFKI